MVKTLEDVKQVHEIANRLTELGIPRKATDRIHQWANKEQKRLRNEARDNPHGKEANESGSETQGT
jgi:hypothetical protein